MSDLFSNEISKYLRSLGYIKMKNYFEHIHSMDGIKTYYRISDKFFQVEVIKKGKRIYKNSIKYICENDLQLFKKQTMKLISTCTL